MPTSNHNEQYIRDDEFIVSKTDKTGKILYGNKVFIRLSGYEEAELLGKPHNIIRHPDMPKVVFALLWERLKAGQEIFAYVKNLSKDGSFYWVFANVTVTVDSNGSVLDYHSVRRKSSDKAMHVVPGLYKELLQAEQQGGVAASKKLLETKLAGESYDNFIFNLQY